MKVARSAFPINTEQSGLAVGSNCYKKAVWYPLVGVTVILFTPESVVSDSEPLKWLIAEAEHWIPAINKLSALSDFPLLMGLYLSVMWVLLPLAVLWWMVRMPMVDTNPSAWLLLRVLIQGALFIALIGSVIYWFPYYPDDRQLSIHAGRSGVFLAVITNSRLGVGFGLGAFFYVLALFIMSWLRTIRLCVTRMNRLFDITP